MEVRKEELETELAEAEEPPPLLHPSLAEVYRERVDALSQALGRPDTREEAAEVIRSLVTAIELMPESGALAIVLRGDLAAMLSFAADKAKPGAPFREAGLVQGSLVAGTGFEPVTFRL